MPNEEQLSILQQGACDWNRWRAENPAIEIDLKGITALSLKDIDLCNLNLEYSDLGGADLKNTDLRGIRFTGADLSGSHLNNANMSGLDLRTAILQYAELNEANLYNSDLTGSNFENAKLRKAILTEARLQNAILINADLYKADLSYASLIDADLSNTILRDANLMYSRLVRTNFESSIITGCKIYGISAWGLKMRDVEQKDLIITPDDESMITVDDIEVAQFFYMLLSNENIGSIIDTIAGKAVLILGRFTPDDRKAIIDVLRSELRDRNYLPIVFDFRKPNARDFTETIKILAGMSHFVIADISNPKSSPLELQATVPDYMVPFVLIIQKDEEPFSMFRDLHNKYEWILKPMKYESCKQLIEALDKGIIKPALQMRLKLQKKKAAELEFRYAKDFI